MGGDIEGGREGVGNHMEVEILRTDLRSCGYIHVAGVGEVLRVRLRGFGHESWNTSIKVLVIQVKVDVFIPLPPSP